jgi:hypothetical protein
MAVLTFMPYTYRSPCRHGLASSLAEDAARCGRSVCALAADVDALRAGSIAVRSLSGALAHPLVRASASVAARTQGRCTTLTAAGD